jgi:hypothetical protein
MQTFHLISELLSSLWLLIAGAYCSCRGFLALSKWAFRGAEKGFHDFLWWNTLGIALLRMSRLG